MLPIVKDLPITRRFPLNEAYLFIGIALTAIALSFFGCEKNSKETNPTQTKTTACLVLGFTDEGNNKVYIEPAMPYYDSISTMQIKETRRFCSSQEARKNGWKPLAGSREHEAAVIKGDTLLELPGFETVSGCGCTFHPLGFNDKATIFAYRYDENSLPEEIAFPDGKSKETTLKIKEMPPGKYYMDRQNGETWQHVWNGAQAQVTIDLTTTGLEQPPESDAILSAKGTLTVSVKGLKQTVLVMGECGC